MLSKYLLRNQLNFPPCSHYNCQGGRGSCPFQLWSDGSWNSCKSDEFLVGTPTVCVLTFSSISLYRLIVLPILLYSREIWSVTETLNKTLNTSGMSASGGSSGYLLVPCEHIRRTAMTLVPATVRRHIMCFSGHVVCVREDEE